MNVDPGFTTHDLAALFSADSRVGLFCRFEAALAEAQAQRGEIPPRAAAAIAEACAEPPRDTDEILALGWEQGTPVLALLERLRSRLSEADAAYLHRGSTTQDVVDTAMMLQCAGALSLLDRSLVSASRRLAALAGEHRRTATMGRTFLQEAVATSFGARFALWLESVVGARRELARVRSRLPIQLAGPVGDMSSLGPDPFRLAEAVAAQLGLAVASAPWHTDRWPVRETAAATARVTAVASKMAGDVALLSSAGEVRVRAGRSSSMSHKRNPVDAIRAEAAAGVSRAAAAGLMGAPSHVLERGMGPWHAEWALVPIALQSAGAAAEAIDRCLASLEVATSERLDGAAGSEVIDRVLEAYRVQEEER